MAFYSEIIGLLLRVHTKKQLSYFSIKTYDVGTQKNRLNETVLLSTQIMLKMMVKKILTIAQYTEKFVYLNL